MRNEATTRAPDFVIIGAQKSASTFLQESLASHPEIGMLAGEIPVMEDPDYSVEKVAEICRRLKSVEGRVLGIKRPNYLGRPEVAERLKKHFPDTKLIAVLRDPVTRAVSAYYHYMRGGFIPALPHELGMARLLGDDTYRSKYPRALEILEFGNYAKHLYRFRKYFSQTQMLVLRHEDILKDSNRELKRVQEFLGVDPLSSIAIRRRPQKVVYDLRRIKWLRIQNHFRVTYNEERTRAFQRYSHIGNLAAALILTVDRYVLRWLWKNQSPVLSRELRQSLEDYYSSDVARLGSMLVCDCEDWLSDRQQDKGVKR